MPEYYELQAEKLKELEKMNVEGKIDLYYGDETRICSRGYIPYGWQFPDEEVYIPSEKAYKLNCFGFISRQSKCHRQTTEQNINSVFVADFPEKFSFEIKKQTFIVLDNAGIHKSKLIRERIPFRQKRGLYICWLPPYSPHLNIAETLWRKLKKE